MKTLTIVQLGNQKQCHDNGLADRYINLFAYTYTNNIMSMTIFNTFPAYAPKRDVKAFVSYRQKFKLEFTMENNYMEFKRNNTKEVPF